MVPIPMPSIASQYGRALTTSSVYSPGTPYVSSSLSTFIVFAAVIASLVLIVLHCTFTRQRFISDARHRLVHQIRVTMPSILVGQPANVLLPIRKYMKEKIGGEGRGAEDCPVCLVEFEEGEEVKAVVPGCQHIFHPVCIDQWLLMRDTCPVCRSAVASVEMGSAEEWRQGEGGDVGSNAERMVVIQERDGGAGGEGEAAVNEENVMVSVEGVWPGGEEGKGEMVVNLESEVLIGDGNRGEGGGVEGEGEGVAAVNEEVAPGGKLDGGVGQGAELGV